MTNEAINTAFKAIMLILNDEDRAKLRTAITYMRDAAVEKLNKEDFKQGEIVRWVFSHGYEYNVIVSDGDPLNNDHFCGTVISGNHGTYVPGTHSNGWLKSEFQRL